MVKGVVFHDSKDLFQQFVAHSDQALFSGFSFCSQPLVKCFAGRISFHRIHRTHVQHIAQRFAATFTDFGSALNAGAAAVFGWTEPCKRN